VRGEGGSLLGRLSPVEQKREVRAVPERGKRREMDRPKKKLLKWGKKKKKKKNGGGTTTKIAGSPTMSHRKRGKVLKRDVILTLPGKKKL